MFIRHLQKADTCVYENPYNSTSPGVPEVSAAAVTSREDVEDEDGNAVPNKRSVVHRGAKIGCTLLRYKHHP